jgi:hypothetical protein
MFTVTVKDTTFVVKFKHLTTGKGQKQRRVTVCAIRRGLDVAQIHLGTATCAPGDQFVKATGRKRAFADAIRLFDRDVRADLWRAYWAHTGKRGLA